MVEPTRLREMPDDDTAGSGQATGQGTSQPAKPPVVVKKYANRRLYNTESSSYVTLEDLAQMVRAGRDFVVYDAKSGDDITRSVLTQIIVEEESKGSAMLPTSFLRRTDRPLWRQHADRGAALPGNGDDRLRPAAGADPPFRGGDGRPDPVPHALRRLRGAGQAEHGDDGTRHDPLSAPSAPRAAKAPPRRARSTCCARNWPR